MLIGLAAINACQASHILLLRKSPENMCAVSRMHASTSATLIYSEKWAERSINVCMYMLRRGCGASAPSAPGSGSNCRRCAASRTQLLTLTMQSPGAMRWVSHVSSL